MNTLVEARNISAIVTLGNGEILHTVNNASLSLERQSTCAIVGRSGSGKTSLISIMGLLNQKYTGTYLFDGTNVGELGDRALSRLRAQKISFVFQNYSLIAHLSAWENVELALQYSQAGRPPHRLLQAKKKGRHARARKTSRKSLCYEALAAVGLADRADELPSRLSGGEQQRVAIARALVTEPALLICDEPTGALDTATSDQVMSTLINLVENVGSSILLVTHDKEIASYCQKVIRMEAGELHAPNAH